MNIFEQNAAVRQVLAEYKKQLPELFDQASMFYNVPGKESFWSGTYGIYSTLKQVVERLEEIFDR